MLFFISLSYFLSSLSLLYIFFTLRSPARSDPPSFTASVQTSTNLVSVNVQLPSEQDNESGSGLKFEKISSFEEESNSTRNIGEKSKKKKRQRNRKTELSSSSDDAEKYEEEAGDLLLSLMRK